jgi:4-hydroxybenzoate polyprenyltransferase
LLALAILISLYVSLWTLGFILFYFLMNVGYSLKLKHIPILDIFIISAGFMLRILTGTVGIGITPSSWILLCGFMLTLFLGFTKRKGELLVLAKNNNGNGGSSSSTRPVLDFYDEDMLDHFISVSAACTILSYALYTVSENAMQVHQTTNLIYSTIFVVYGIYRYIFLLHRHQKGGDTAKDILTDHHLLITISGYIIFILWIIL